MRLFAPFLSIAIFWHSVSPAIAQSPSTLSCADYEDRVHAAWLGQMIGVLMTLPHEHKVSSVATIDAFPKPYKSVMMDDDWYYEMIAVRGFETYGPGLTVDQLGQLWQRHNCGTWGSSKYALEAMKRGVAPADAGLPEHNRLWFTIGPMFSCEVYGIIAPGRPNLAGKLARDLGRINGHAEGLDAGVFAAGVVSLGFCERDPRTIVRRAARLIDPLSPMRQAIDQVIELAETGKSFAEVCAAVEDRWHVEYPATNNAVANGGILATCLWYGEGDFLKSINLAASSGDFVDVDNIAAVACATVGAMHGMSALPRQLVEQLNDRVAGGDMAGLMKLTPPVDESIRELARRTAAVGWEIAKSQGGRMEGDSLVIPSEEVVTQSAELYTLAELAKTWNPDWKLERAGFGGGDGGLKGMRGQTYREGDVLATYPRDEVRGLVLRREVTPGQGGRLAFQAGVDPGRVWRLEVYAQNERLFSKIVEAPAGTKTRHWEAVSIDLTKHAGRPTTLRLFQLVLIDGKTAGNAYWKDLRVE